MFKTVVTTIACLVFMIWCIVKAKGVGPIIHQPGTLHGSDLAWNMIVGISVCISNMITLTTYVHRAFHVSYISYHDFRNAPDFGSRAESPSSPIISQAWSIPFSYGAICLLGVIVSSSSQTIYGEAIWSPVDLLGRFLDDNPSGGARFGVSLNSRRRYYVILMQKVMVGRVHWRLFHYCSGRHHK